MVWTNSCGFIHNWSWISSLHTPMLSIKNFPIFWLIFTFPKIDFVNFFQWLIFVSMTILTIVRKYKVLIPIFSSIQSLSFSLPYSLHFSALFNFRPSCFFFGWPKIKGAEIFPKPLFNSKQKRKKIIYRRWPKIKGAELGEGGRKLEGPKIKGDEN